MECKTSIICICLGILLIHTSPCVNLGVCVCLFVHACRLCIPTLIDETCQEFNCATLGKVSYFKLLLLGISSIHVQVLPGTPPKSFLPCQIHLTWLRYVLLRIYLHAWLHCFVKGGFRVLLSYATFCGKLYELI